VRIVAGLVTVGCAGLVAARLVASPVGASPPVVLLGHTRTFPAGQLHPGGLVACVGHGARIVARAPAAGPGRRTIAIAWVRGLSLQIRSAPHGSYVATCG